MVLQPSSSSRGILYLSFNQDNTCIAVADYKGIKIFSLQTHRVCYQADIGSISIAEMLYCTSLLAFAGAGEQPALTSRNLTLMNTHAQRSIKELSFQHSVLAVRMNRKRLIVVLDKATHVHALETLERLKTLETPSNPKGICELCVSDQSSLLALPSSAQSGTLRVYDVLSADCSLLTEINAHKTSVAAITWNQDGSLLATASDKGTVVRVHRLPEGSKELTFRRGSYPATITSLAFTPLGVGRPMLCACSIHGTIHFFSLEALTRPGPVRTASGILSNVVPPSVSDAYEPQRSIASVRLPTQGVPAMVAVVKSREAQSSSSDSKTIPDMSASEIEDNGDVDLLVATADGIMYEYAVSDSRGSSPWKVHLERESVITGSSSDTSAR
ncbi:hypothetical protein WJX74_002611 [Apatococcus lobatus]|uniref:Autophagy-related protein 18 n=2 Tax=Apatococcus TaxID=904362 RepID=A0AAW1QZE3_9CHLO